MPPSFSSPEDDAFALRVFHDRFQKQVRKASKPIFPKILLSERDDIIQEALVKACQRRTQFEGTTDVELLGWVLRILQNLTRDILKARKDLPVQSRLPEEMVDRKMPDPALVAEGADTGEEDVPLPAKPAEWLVNAQGILDKLSEEGREVLLLHLGKGFTIAEITQLLVAEGKDVTEAAVKMRVYRALKFVHSVAEAMGLPRKDQPAPAGPQNEEKTDAPRG